MLCERGVAGGKDQLNWDSSSRYSKAFLNGLGWSKHFCRRPLHSTAEICEGRALSWQYVLVAEASQTPDSCYQGQLPCQLASPFLWVRLLACPSFSLSVTRFILPSPLQFPLRRMATTMGVNVSTTDGKPCILQWSQLRTVCCRSVHAPHWDLHQ
jgi:hypothetical protein